jgi:hypothetical protein
MNRNHESDKFTFIKRGPESIFIKSGPKSALIKYRLYFFRDPNLRVEYEYGYEYRYRYEYEYE